MKIYAIEEAHVKPAPSSAFNLTETFKALDEMRASLADLTARLQATAGRLFPHNDLCEYCDQFAPDCLVVDYQQAMIDGPQMVTETLCATCRREVA